MVAAELSAVSVSSLRSMISPVSRSHASVSWIMPTPRIAAWGGLITGVIAVIPYMPRLETVKVAPLTSGGVISWLRTRSARRRCLGGEFMRPFRVGIEHG